MRPASALRRCLIQVLQGHPHLETASPKSGGPCLRSSGSKISGGLKAVTCSRMRAGRPLRGIHTEACRQRIEAQMREDARGRVHLERAAERFARQVAEPAEGASEEPRSDANVAYVRYQGLTMRSDLNGFRAQLLRHDEVRGRWQTKAPDGKIYRVKPENFCREDNQVPNVNAEVEADWPPGEHLDDGGGEEEA